MNAGPGLGETLEVAADDRLDPFFVQAGVPRFGQGIANSFGQYFVTFAPANGNGIITDDHPTTSQRLDHTFVLQLREGTRDGIGIDGDSPAKHPGAGQKLAGLQRTGRDGKLHLPCDLQVNRHIALEIDR